MMKPHFTHGTIIMRIWIILSLLLFSPILLTACGGVKTERSGPVLDNEQERKLNRGKLTGSEGGFSLFGSGEENTGSGGGNIGVNGYLWRATLDTLAFMPLTSADPFGGVIITDWYEDPKTPGERFKVNAMILDKALRSDGIKIKVFKQAKDKKGNWMDTQVADSVGRGIEDAILTRAREMRVAGTKKK